MYTIKGKYNTAVIMADYLDQPTTSQIYTFLNHPAFAHSHIAIMKDAHFGVGSCIGFTMEMTDYIIPNVVGVDIGCGVSAYPLKVSQIDRTKLDEFIKENVPCGYNIRDAGKQMITSMTAKKYFDAWAYEHAISCESIDIDEIVRNTRQDRNRVVGSVGTLGGGNHFIEIDRTDEGQYWLLIHSGSRKFGMDIAKYHQAKAKKLLKRMFVGADAYKGLEYLPMGMGAEEYLKDMRIAQTYATLNRKVMAEVILTFFDQSIYDVAGIDTIHNYINFEDKIIRKGAVSANDGERLIIPFNSLQGVAICTGKGSKKWNCSAPHGAGRIMSRTQAKRELDVEQYKKDMADADVYTTTANAHTIDECWKAYKNKDEVVEAIGETVDIEFFMKPVYNFKSSGD